MSPDELLAENHRLRRVAGMLAPLAANGLDRAGVPVRRMNAGQIADLILLARDRQPPTAEDADAAAAFVDAFLARLSAEPTEIKPEGRR